MTLDEMDAIHGNVSVLDVQCAIVDGINLYKREVLVPRGICDPEKDQDHAGSEQNARKYQIAEQVALNLIHSKGGQTP